MGALLGSIWMPAASAKSCYCETGTSPSSEAPLFWIGCKLWLAGQNGCGSKKIVANGYDYLGSGDSFDSEIAIGYVGHWGSSSEMVDYVNSSVYPLMSRTDSSVIVDNTACLAMSDPEKILAAMSQWAPTFKPGQTLAIRGNQTVSVGEWSILPGFGSMDFPAVVSSTSGTVQYPKCEGFRDNNCFAAAQAGKDAVCENNDGSLTALSCCSVLVPGQGRQRATYVRNELWETETNCGKLGQFLAGHFVADLSSL